MMWKHVLTCLMSRVVLITDREPLACTILLMLVMRSSCVLPSSDHKLGEFAFCMLLVLLRKRYQLGAFPVFSPHSMHTQCTDLCHELFYSKHIGYHQTKPT